MSNGVLKEGFEAADWICLAQTRGQFRGGAVGEARHLWLSQNGTNFLKTGTIVSFSRTALHGVYRSVGRSQRVECANNRVRS